MSEIFVPESAKPRKPPDIDYAIRRLDIRIRHNRNECGDILLTDEIVMDIGLDALRYAEMRIKVLEEALLLLQARIEELEKSWLLLLREIAKFDSETTDWEGADDGTFLEEFDPWHVLRLAALAAKEKP